VNPIFPWLTCHCRKILALISSCRLQLVQGHQRSVVLAGPQSVGYPVSQNARSGNSWEGEEDEPMRSHSNGQGIPFPILMLDAQGRRGRRARATKGTGNVNEAEFPIPETALEELRTSYPNLVNQSSIPELLEVAMRRASMRQLREHGRPSGRDDRVSRPRGCSGVKVCPWTTVRMR
jgi:hypothetical protein